MVALLNKKQPIRVDENNPILAKATKVDALCTDKRDYYLLDAGAATDADLTSLSLQQSDSISTTVSDESDSIRVYDLDKRETKILRHGIIKRSRNPIGEFDETLTNNLTGPTLSSPLEATIQQFNRKIFEHAKETRKPPISPNKLSSVHLNRSPRNSKMADVHLSSEETVIDGGTITTTTTIKPISMISTNTNNVEIIEKKIESETHADEHVSGSTPDVVQKTENLLENEREHSAVAVAIVTAVERKLSAPDQQEESANFDVEAVEIVENAFSDETAHDDAVRAATVHEKTRHIEATIDEEEPIIERQIEQNGSTNKLSDAEIAYGKQTIDDNDEESNVEIVEVSTEESIELVPATHETFTSVDDNGKIIRDHQFEVVIVSRTKQLKFCTHSDAQFICFLKILSDEWKYGEECH